MADRAQTTNGKAVLSSGSVDAFAAEAPDLAAARSAKEAGATAPKAIPPANKRQAAAAERRAAAERGKAERRLAREIRQEESDDRFTPPDLIRAIEESLGKIDFDPCWHPASAVRPAAYLNVREGHNGLRGEWKGRLAFVNPPWSNQAKWVERAHDQWLKRNVEVVVCLTPAATSAKYFSQVLSKDADVFFVEGRPRFFKEDGTSEPTMTNIMIIMLGATTRQRMRFAELVKGSWWRPEQLLSIGTGPACDDAGGEIAFHASVSCVARHSLRSMPVLCGPFAGRA